MKKIIYLTESDLYRITKRIIKEEELREGIFDGISNVFQGLKGVWRGEGYDFFRFMNQLKNTVGDLKKHSKSIDKLRNLKNKVTNSKMAPEKKAELIKEIDKLILAFDKYSEELNQVDQNVRNRLAGNTSHIPYMDTSKDDKRKHHSKLKKDTEPSIDDLTSNEKKELENYGYYDEDDYNEILQKQDINQKIKNKVSVTIGGKTVDIEDKSRPNLDKNKVGHDPHKRTNSPTPTPTPTPNNNNRHRTIGTKDPADLNKSNVSERRYRRY